MYGLSWTGHLGDTSGPCRHPLFLGKPKFMGTVWQPGREAVLSFFCSSPLLAGRLISCGVLHGRGFQRTGVAWAHPSVHSQCWLQGFWIVPIVTTGGREGARPSGPAIWRILSWEEHWTESLQGVRGGGGGADASIRAEMRVVPKIRTKISHLKMCSRVPKSEKPY